MTADDFDDETTFWRQQRTDGHTVPADIDAMRLDAGTVRCRRCFAPPDRDCVNPITGKPLKRLPCHPIRLTDARKAHA